MDTVTLPDPGVFRTVVGLMIERGRRCSTGHSATASEDTKSGPPQPSRNRNLFPAQTPEGTRSFSLQIHLQGHIFGSPATILTKITTLDSAVAFAYCRP